jgi:hypothetical protein
MSPGVHIADSHALRVYLGGQHDGSSGGANQSLRRMSSFISADVDVFLICLAPDHGTAWQTVLNVPPLRPK